MLSRLHPSRFAAACLAAVLLLSAGCHAPQPNPNAAMPNHGPRMTDARTEAIIQEMELDYITGKNSQPTFQGYVMAKQREQEQAAAAKQAAEEAAAKQAAEEAAKKPGKKTKTPKT